MTIRNNKVLYNASAAGTGAWFRLDARYEETSQRAIQGTVTSGDTITFQGTTKDFKPPHPYVGGLDETAFLATLVTADISTLGSYTADFSDILNGNWTYIRVVKTGTAGTSKVQGCI